ncbi:MAG: ROK family protein [Rikenellaceae bacterium]|nr:ROK family protein [Rikenellaceae bacterium]
MTDKKAYIVADVGGTYLKTAVMNPDGELFPGSSSMTEAHSEGSREEILEAMRYAIVKEKQILEQNGARLSGIAMTFPGPFNYFKGISLMEHKFKELKNIDLKESISKMPEIGEKIPVVFRHDANSLLAGELWRGNAVGYRNAAAVTLGTGLGFAFSRDGVVQQNEIGGPLITIFRIPYNDGILEDYTSKRGFLSLYKNLSGKESIEGVEVSDIGRWASEGDPTSQRVFEEVGVILARSLKPLLKELEIECLLFGGQISRSFHCMESKVKDELKDMKTLKLISVVRSIENAPLWGALQSIENNVIV